MTAHLHSGDGAWTISEIVGPYTWGALHYLADNFPCPPCAEHGGVLMRGLHDVVNFGVGNPIMFPEDLQHLASEAAEAVASLKAGAFLPLGARNFPTCNSDQGAKFERCVGAVKHRDPQPDSPFAVCTASVGCSPN